MRRRDILDGVLPLIFDENTEIMIFGSFPGEQSIAKQQYYGNAQNHFWRIMGNILGEDFSQMRYAERIDTLLKHKIGLWDTYQSVERKGSLDSSIRNAKMNDFSQLKKIPKLKVIAFNGQLSGKGALAVASLGYRTVTLPSSSPAHTMRIDEKILQWRKIF